MIVLEIRTMSGYPIASARLEFFRGLLLALRDRLDAAANDLRDERAGVDDEAEHQGGELRAEPEAAAVAEALRHGHLAVDRRAGEQESERGEPEEHGERPDRPAGRPARPLLDATPPSPGH